MEKKIYIFGNIDLPNDSLPLRILPNIEEKFPNILFVINDPNEEWDVEDEIVIIDTVVGIKEITIFYNLENFLPAPRLSVHDFDALTNLRLLQKIGRIKSVKIIGVPQDLDEQDAILKISKIITDIFPDNI